MQNSSLVSAAVLLLAATGAAGAETGSLDLEAIQRVFPGAPIPLPKEVFPPAYRQALLAKKDAMLAGGLLHRADEYVKTPAAVWRDRIPRRVGFGYILAGLNGPTERFNYTCPACLRMARFGRVDVYGGTVTMDCCGAVFPEDPAAYPAGAPGKPNQTMRIPHLDGTVVEYSYYEFADRVLKDQKTWVPWKPADGSPTHEVFLADGYIRAYRLHAIINNVIPDLGWAYFHTGKAEYANLLAEVLDRLAELYPGWPLWMPYAYYNFALNRTGDGILTREEYDAAIRPMRWGTQFWNTPERAMGFGHMKTGALMPQYGMQQVAALVKAYAAIRDSEAVKAWSQAKYGAPDGLEKRVMQGLFGEMVKLYKCYQPWFGNYTQAYFEGGVLLSLLTQDRYFFDVVNALMERSIYDEGYADHAVTQGSLSYVSMVCGPLASAFQMRQELYDPEVEQRHPRLAYLLGRDGGELRRSLTSWRWVEPAFGDAWNRFYHQGIQEGTRATGGGFSSTHLPDYGVSMLRWGEADGRRQEVCVVYQRVAGHAHSDALNTEYFVDGMPVLWDMGYGDGAVETDVRQYPGMKEIVEAGWPRPVLNTAPFVDDCKGKTPFVYLFFTNWNNRAASHCTVMVDEKEPTTAWNSQGAGMPITLTTETELDPAKRLLEVLDVDEKGVFPGGPKVDEYRRTLMTVKTPGGGGYLVDVFRVAGGKMHELYYHAISEKADTDLPKGTPQPGTLAHYRDCTRRQTERMKELDNPESPQVWGWSNGYRFIQDLEKLEPAPQHWRLSWEYDPLLYAPKTAEARKKVENLLATQKPVTLAIHGVRTPGTEQQAILWRARGLLTGHLVETLKDGTKLDGGWRSNVGFVGGLDMLIQERRGAEGLKSVFAHVLEGRRADLPAEVVAVESLPGENAPEGAVALRVKLRDGSQDYVFSLKDKGEFRGEGVYFKGRYGVLRLGPDGNVLAACLVRGSKLLFKDFAMAAVPEYACEARRFEGDLTGDRSKPAIVVTSAQPLPDGKALAGNSIHVTSPDGWTDVYVIDSIAALGGNEWRIALRNHPTFIIDFLTVGRGDEKNPQAFFCQEVDLSKGICGAIYGHNVALVSLKDGKCHPADMDTVNCQYSRITLRAPGPSFAASGLSTGDKAILVRHRPGDRVVIPVCQVRLAREP